jgi:hypothetical protein
MLQNPQKLLTYENLVLELTNIGKTIPGYDSYSPPQ